MIIFGTKLKFLPYKRKEIVIFDFLHSKYIERCLALISSKSYQVVHTRYETLCIFAIFSIKFYKILISTKKLKLAYFAGIFDFINPSKAITFIDNNVYFYELSLIFRKTKFYSIQNSNHFLCCDRNENEVDRYKIVFLNIKPKYYPVTYFSIGKYEKVTYPKNCNYRFKEIIPVGSLATACRFYSKSAVSIPLIPSFDLGIIGNSNYCSNTGLDDNLMLSYIRELLNIKDDLKVCYISKFEKGSEESEAEKIYIDIFFNGRLAYKSKDSNLDTLEICSNCNILVGTISALLREAYTVGIKILCVNTLPFSHSMVYDNISFNAFPKFDTFLREIDNLLSISRKAYFEKYDFKFLDFNTFEGNTAIHNIAKQVGNLN